MFYPILKNTKITKIYKLIDMIRSYSLFATAVFFAFFILASCSESGKEKTYFVNFETTEGTIKVKLYNSTPLHRDNFIKLVKDKYYDNISFHRVIEDFMIQAGDYRTRPDLASDTSNKYVYTIPAEIKKENFHKRGALAAARTGDRFNPERESSGTQFYIVQGQKFSDRISEEGDTISADSLIAGVEKRINSSLKQNIFYNHLKDERQKSKVSGDNRTDAEIQQAATLLTYDDLENFQPIVIPDEHREVYINSGGTPHLDMQYTVFGEVVEGMNVVDSIAATKTDRTDKPVKDIKILKARITRK